MDGQSRARSDALTFDRTVALAVERGAALSGLGSLPPRGSPFYRASKRLFDIVFSAIALMVGSPFFLIIAIAIKRSYRDVPVFFAVDAVGRGRRNFRMWKFSTMIPNAHLVQEQMLRDDPVLAEEWKRSVKLKHDPRILPGVGNFLRRTSLNELPQFYNVLIGEMSLVGPRPITRQEEALYIEYGGVEILQQRYSVRPGVTGLWQINGRNGVPYAERIVYDRAYLAKPSFLADLRIILGTIQGIFRPVGAY
jgi:exopolysaccharide production protein ExoY